ncbi:MAG: polyprenyl synthetase family protein [Muribaculaceae bacterium]|nr:polyprenyl synthetase family protein [Muribaculaceae bacterium]
MTTLDNITRAHKPDLDRLNDRIANQLQTTNSLMSRIVLSLLRTKGKQLRPLLLMMCAKMFGPVDDKVLASAAAVELLHNASLIHDDVVDNSMTRRGCPTVNAVWDNHISVLVGDFFTSSAMQEAISTGDIRIVDSLCKLGRQLSLGEIDQIYNAREHSLTEEGYYRIIDYKTASLFVSSASMGCFAAGAPDREREALEKYALLFGRCFQIRDDVFDYFPSELVGKPTGNDLREGKVSLPLLHALEATSGDEHDRIMELLGRGDLSDSEIALIQAFARDNGGIDYAFDIMHRLRIEACAELENLFDSPIRSELTALFDFIIERQF